jgi:putative membrane protein
MIKPIHLVILPSVLVLSLALLCCGGEPPAKSADNVPPASASQANAASVASGAPEAMPNSTASTSAVAGVSAPPADAPTVLSDEQIVQIIHTANMGEIAQAKLALSKAKDSRVQKLAAMMLKDHASADGKDMALARKVNLSLAPSPTNASLESDARTATSALESETGVNFDKSYVDTQVKEHQAVLDMIDQKLIPNAKSSDVRSFLAEVRPTIAIHLQHAQDLQASGPK